MTKPGCSSGGCPSGGCSATNRRILAQRPEGPQASPIRAQACLRNALMEVHTLGSISGDPALLAAAKSARDALRLLRSAEETTLTPTPAPHRGLVVVLDASRCNVTFLNRMLTGMGFAVAMTQHAREALAAMREPDAVAFIVNGGTLPTFDKLRISQAVADMDLRVVAIDDDELASHPNVAALPAAYEPHELLDLLGPVPAVAEAVAANDPELEILDPVTEMLAGRATLPGLAPIAAQLGRLMGQFDLGVDDVVEVVGSDPAVVISVLRVANSSRYSVVREITSLHDACVRLGNEMVVSIAQEVVLEGAVQFGAEPHRTLAKRMWRNFVATADLAMRIAAQTGHSQPARVRTAALLHNIGDLLLLHRAAAFANRWARAGVVASERLAEQSAAEHADLGGALLEAWAMPRLYVRCARQHHDDVRASGAVGTAIDIVTLAWKLVVRSGITYLPGQISMAGDLVSSLRRVRIAADVLEEETAAAVRQSA